MKRFKQWQDPDNVGASEYRAIYDHADNVLTGAELEGETASFAHKLLETSLREMRDYIDDLLGVKPLTAAERADVAEALGRAAEAVEDVDDPKHYSREELKAIRDKAKRYRALAKRFQDA